MSLYLAADVERGLAVWRFAGPQNRDEDYQRYIDTILELDAACPVSVRGAALLLIDDDNPTPNVKWRKKIAEATATLRMDRPLFAVVSSRFIVRGVIQA